MIPDPRNPSPLPESIVLSILGKTPRLTTQNLYQFFNKKYPKGMSLQGFYNLIKQLIGLRILVKDGQLLSIEASWIHHLVNFAESLKQTYLQNQSITSNIILEEGESKEFMTNNMIALDNLWDHIMTTTFHYYQAHPHDDKNMYIYNHHSWFHIIKPQTQISLTQILKEMKLKWFLVNGSNSFLDKLAGQQIENSNFIYQQIEQGDLIKSNYYLSIIGDFIAEVTLPNYLAGLLENIYQTTKTLSDFNSQEIQTLAVQNYKIKLIISHDKKRAENLRSKVKKIFEK